MRRAEAVRRDGVVVCRFPVMPVYGMDFSKLAEACFAMLNPGVYTGDLTFRECKEAEK